MPAAKDNQYAKKHGIYALDKSGPKTLSPFEIDSLAELRELARTEPGRNDLRVEIIARLAIIARKFFSDGAKIQHDPLWWESGIVKHGGTYLAELRRWLDSMPPDQRPDDANVIDVLKSLDEEKDDQSDSKDD